MWSVRRALSCSRSGWGKPRSAKTLPLPFLTRMVLFFFMSVVPLPIVPLCRSEPLFDEFDFFLRRGDAFLGLLLKGVQHVNSVAEAHRVDGPEGVALIGRYDLKHSAPAETFEGFDGGGIPRRTGLHKEPAPRRAVPAWGRL